MRKLLLTSAAVLGVTFGLTDMGYAQSDDDSGQSAGPAPGTLTVRLNGRFRFYAGVAGESDQTTSYYYDPATGRASETPFTTGTLTGVTTVAKAGGGFTSTPVFAQAQKQYNKLNTQNVFSYVRLYPGFDGVAANGLKYGASAEIRQDNNAGAGSGIYGSNSQQSRAKGYLYFRREWGYVGTDQLGTLRFGGTDGPSGLFLTGNFENFNDGGWNGDVVFAMLSGQAQVTYPFADVGNLYTTEKVVYLSPQFYGFDFGIAYEPNTQSVNGDGSNGCNAPSSLGATFIGAGPGVAGAGCNNLASTTTGDYTRRQNLIDTALRYRGTFGPVGLATFVNYIGSGHVNDQGALTTALSTTGAVTNTITARQAYEGLNVGVGGAALTYGGFSVGGLVQGGAVNGQWSLQPKGEPNGFAWLVGASYTVGPVIVGASYFDYFSAGNALPTNTVGHRRELGLNVGGTYSVAPGLAVFLAYDWGQRHENNYNFITNQNGSNLHNTINAQVFTIGTSLTW